MLIDQLYQKGIIINQEEKVKLLDYYSKDNRDIKEELKKKPIEDLITMFDKDIYLSPKENIVMICTPNDPSNDMVMTVSIKDGEYFLKSLDVKNEEYNASYENNKTNEEPENNNSMNKEVEAEKEEIGSTSKTLKKINKPYKRPENSNVYPS